MDILGEPRESAAIETRHHVEARKHTRIMCSLEDAHLNV
jgi:hypothetical protein